MDDRSLPSVDPFESTLLGWPAIFGGLLLFLAVPFWLSWFFDADPVPLAVPLGLTGFGVGLLVLWRRSTLRLTEDGRLRVRFIRPFRTHELDLTALATVEDAWPRTHGSFGGPVRLTDRNGQSVTISFGWWRNDHTLWNRIVAFLDTETVVDDYARSQLRLWTTGSVRDELDELLATIPAPAHPPTGRNALIRAVVGREREPPRQVPAGRLLVDIVSARFIAVLTLVCLGSTVSGALLLWLYGPPPAVVSLDRPVSLRVEGLLPGLVWGPILVGYWWVEYRALRDYRLVPAQLIETGLDREAEQFPEAMGRADAVRIEHPRGVYRMPTDGFGEFASQLEPGTTLDVLVPPTREHAHRVVRVRDRPTPGGVTERS